MHERKCPHCPRVFAPQFGDRDANATRRRRLYHCWLIHPYDVPDADDVAWFDRDLARRLERVFANPVR